MNKHILFTFLISLVANWAQAQCNVTIQNTTLDTLEVPCGSQVMLERDTLGAYAIYNDFNNGNVGLGWQTTSSAALNNPCGSNGSTYLWFGNTSTAPRNLTTVPLDLSCGGQICFELRFSVQGSGGFGGSPCEGPDLAGEGVTFEWRQGTGTWNSIFYFQPNTSGSFNSLSPGSGDYTGWATYCYPIPLAAQAPNIQIRWQQYASTASGNDHWGLDSITVSTNCGAVDNIWSTGDSTQTTVTPPAFGDSLYWTQRIVGVGSASPDTCYDSVVVSAQLPRVNINPQFVPFCTGNDAIAGINPNQIQFADPSVTYSTQWYPQTGVFDSTSQYYARVDDIMNPTMIWYTFEHPQYPQCSTADTVTLQVGGVEFDSITVFNPDCFRDQNSGSVSFTWKNQLTPPISTVFRNGTWFNASAGNQYNNLPNDTFTLTIRDARCFDTIGFRLETPDTLLVDTSQLVLDICQTITKAQLATGINGIAPYTAHWNGNPVSTAPLALKANNDTTLALHVEDAVGCISDTLNITFEVPDPIVIQPIDTAVCPGDTLALEAIASGGLGQNAYRYRWHNNVRDSIVTVVPQPGNSYSVRVEDGCTFYASIIPDVFINPVPDDGLEITPSTCLGNDVEIKGPAGMAFYEIVVNDSDTLINQRNTYTASDTGEYIVRLYTETTDGCLKYDTSGFEIIPLPKAEFSFDSTKFYRVRENAEVLFTNESSFASNYLWFTLDAESNDVDFLHEFTQPGTHRIDLVAYNSLGCADSTFAMIDIAPDNPVMAPNSFTPNGDGLNDVWEILLPSYVDEFDIWVYNRWGNLVWESHDVSQNKWDGKDKTSGTFVPQGVYVYRIYIAAPENELDFKEEYNGTVNVINSGQGN